MNARHEDRNPVTGARVQGDGFMPEPKRVTERRTRILPHAADKRTGKDASKPGPARPVGNVVLL